MIAGLSQFQYFRYFNAEYLLGAIALFIIDDDTIAPQINSEEDLLGITRFKWVRKFEMHPVNTLKSCFCGVVRS